MCEATTTSTCPNRSQTEDNSRDNEEEEDDDDTVIWCKIAYAWMGSIFHIISAINQYLQPILTILRGLGQ